MAYPDTPLYLGNQYPNDASTSTETERRALALTLASGEIMNVFEDPSVNELEPLIKHFNLSGGKSLRVPVSGLVNAAFHKPGTTIVTQQTKQTEITLSVDDVLYVALQYPDFYEKLLDFQLRPEYTRKAGYALAQANCTAIFLKIIAAARTAAYIPGETFGGARIITDKFKVATGGAADIAEQSLNFLYALAEAQILMDQKNIPAEGRYAYFKPRDYSNMMMAIQANGFSLANKFYMENTASINSGTLPVKICGFYIRKSNFMPNGTNWNAGKSSDSNPNVYFANGSAAYHTNQQIDATKTVALLFTQEAVAKVNYMGLQVKSEWQIKELSDLFVAYMACGYNVYNPSCAIELALSSLTY